MRWGRHAVPAPPPIGFDSFRAFCAGGKDPIWNRGVQIGKQPVVVRAHRLGGGRCCCRCGCAWREGSGDVVVEESGSCQGCPSSPHLDSGFRRKEGVGRSPPISSERGPPLICSLLPVRMAATPALWRSSPRRTGLAAAPGCRWGIGGGRCPRLAPRTRRWWRGSCRRCP